MSVCHAVNNTRTGDFYKRKVTASGSCGLFMILCAGVFGLCLLGGGLFGAYPSALTLAVGVGMRGIGADALDVRGVTCPAQQIVTLHTQIQRKLMALDTMRYMLSKGCVRWS